MKFDFCLSCDELNKLPEANKDNWLAEIELLKKGLPQKANVLQVGCMDGTRIIHLLKVRPDLIITGLDIEKDLLALAKENLKGTNLKVNLVEGDITKPLPFSNFDYVICLNNTLGYIDDEYMAIENMKKMGKKLILSVYSEKFTDELGLTYFKAIGLKINQIKDNIFQAERFINIKRYARDEVNRWSGEVIETPIGYFCIINT
jgi:SAM-dependent methyltransferase